MSKLEQSQEASRSADDDVKKLVHLQQLLSVLINRYPAKKSKNANWIMKMGRHRSDGVFGLSGELTGGLHDEALWSVQTLHYMVQAGYSKAYCFTCPTLADAEQINPFDRNWNGEELDGRRQNVSAGP